MDDGLQGPRQPQQQHVVVEVVRRLRADVETADLVGLLGDDRPTLHSCSLHRTVHRFVHSDEQGDTADITQVTE